RLARSGGSLFRSIWMTITLGSSLALPVSFCPLSSARPVAATAKTRREATHSRRHQPVARIIARSFSGAWGGTAGGPGAGRSSADAGTAPARESGAIRGSGELRLALSRASLLPVLLLSFALRFLDPDNLFPVAGECELDTGARFQVGQAG